MDFWEDKPFLLSFGPFCKGLSQYQGGSLPSTPSPLVKTPSNKIPANCANATGSSQGPKAELLPHWRHPDKTTRGLVGWLVGW